VARGLKLGLNFHPYGRVKGSNTEPETAMSMPLSDGKIYDIMDPLDV